MKINKQLKTKKDCITQKIKYMKAILEFYGTSFLILVAILEP